MKFSCLMSCYAKDDPKALKECFESLLAQTRRATEIILVKDGPLTKDLENVIEVYSNKLPIQIITIAENKGLGHALNMGVRACKYEIIARIDADDICAPDRFEGQLKQFEIDPNLDVVGTWISEFENDPNQIYAYRELPVNHEDIFKYAKKRNPINHMTVAFKKKSVIDAGNYDPDFKFAQDYLLWANMLMRGCRFMNIPRYLVNARAGIEMLQRRGGRNYFSYEIGLQKKFYEIGLIGRIEFLSNLVIRGFVRLIPNGFRGFIYKNILRK
jgi:glycosyltransferase involved in cell wall biosynthesis